MTVHFDPMTGGKIPFGGAGYYDITPEDKNQPVIAKGVSATKNANQDLTELVYIVDCSGSMCGLESDTIGGFNASLKKQKEVPGDVKVSLIFFNNRSKVVVDRADLSEIKPLSENDYQTSGCTALLDAVGGAINHIGKVQGYMPDEYKAGHVIFTIITDGYENASSQYTYSKVKKMITAYEEMGWEFLFLGANIDAAAEAGRLGIKADRAANYCADSQGNQIAYEAMACATAKIRSCAPNQRIGGEWADAVEADYKKRKGLFRR